MTTSGVYNGNVGGVELSAAKAAAWLGLTTFLAVAVLAIVGIEQGATSIFGDTVLVHEFMHDARHLLGFPCH